MLYYKATAAVGLLWGRGFGVSVRKRQAHRPDTRVSHPLGRAAAMRRGRTPSHDSVH